LRKPAATPFAALRGITLLAFAAVITAFQICGALGIRINTSPSLPVGIYVVASESSSRLVEFCPAGPFATVSIERRYRDRGSCPDGAAPLLKPVAARPGDVVDFSAAGIAINRKLLRNTAPLAADTEGRPLAHWRFGHYLVTEGTLWVVSAYHPRSFDSRYFGPIATSAVHDHLRPVLTLCE
jgi:conjugative transfer signal peptidase TraF